MSITKRVEGPTTAWPGDDVVFVIEYRNNGTTPINGFRIIDHRPSSLQFRTSILTSTNLNINNRIVNINTTPLVWNFADTILQPGQSDSIKITWTIKQNIQ
jgi:uncharacterized repeat protein (TIGR01451 family)